LILQSFLAKLSNRTESLTVDVRYLAFSIADSASRFWSAAFVYLWISLKLAWPVIAAISCIVQPASARGSAAGSFHASPGPPAIEVPKENDERSRRVLGQS
jgi:hypothetical protein